MRHAAIFQSDLGVGGIQKSLINLLNNIDLTQFQVDLYLIDDSQFFKMNIPPAVQVRRLKKYPFLTKFIWFDWLRTWAPRPVSDKAYDIAIDFNSYQNECAVGALSVKARRRVMWIHNDVAKKKAEDVKYRILWHFFKGKLKHFDEFVAVSAGVVEPFQTESGITDKPITVIPNYIDTREIHNRKTEPVDFSVDPDRYNLVSMGRLCHQKGFDLLIEHMKAIVGLRPDMKLYIIGEGPDRPLLEQQIRDSHLEDHVELLGNLANPFPYLDRMDGFALTSRYEGQGMVILEALALGLNIFVTKNLEVYNEGIPGCDDFVTAVAAARKQPRVPDDLADYNQTIIRKIEGLLGGSGSTKTGEI